MSTLACCVLLVMVMRELMITMFRFRKMTHSTKIDEQKKLFWRIISNVIFLFTLIYTMGRVIM